MMICTVNLINLLVLNTYVLYRQLVSIANNIYSSYADEMK
jgi:hypothetical protein